MKVKGKIVIFGDKRGSCTIVWRFTVDKTKKCGPQGRLVTRGRNRFLVPYTPSSLSGVPFQKRCYNKPCREIEKDWKHSVKV